MVRVGTGCDTNLTGRPSMTDEMMILRARIEKGSDAHLLREVIGLATRRLVKLVVGELNGALFGAKSTGQQVQRNGSRDRLWNTRVGTMELVDSLCGPSPRLGKGSGCPGFPGPRRRAATAPAAVIQEPTSR